MTKSKILSDNVWGLAGIGASAESTPPPSAVERAKTSTATTPTQNVWTASRAVVTREFVSENMVRNALACIPVAHAKTELLYVRNVFFSPFFMMNTSFVEVHQKNGGDNKVLRK